ncbi:glycerol-3-phosphate 1-O-acyltransferase PlsY [Sulfuriflexus mobilis]|uniref:glycerol-3-phosphate 1-O-acyltransferase PlsY n=1 Tax=Sulfuriflexus mobilis TaxID=1811807 RepID=UPI000F8391EC|nr:glycerol-3-phosphate 1-O-acyltransferase PlsY [Sulfuriflexus mobilis]
MQILDYSLILAGYLFGSVSSAIIICKLMRLPDPRTQGSNNPGATNVLRFGGKKAAAIVLLGDMAKGVIPILVARLAGADALVLAVVGFAAFIGHLYPVFFGFRGGKGVATAFGVFATLNWQVGLALIGTWLLIAKVFKISSLAALTAAVLTPLYLWWLSGEQYWVSMSIIMSAILIWRHRSNIQKLLSGKEDSIGTDVDES